MSPIQETMPDPKNDNCILYFLRVSSTMKTLYLGNRCDDVREFEDDAIVLITPNAHGIGRVESKKSKDAYLGIAWDRLICTQQYFYYREINRKTGNGVVCANEQEALAAATSWVEETNKNTKDTIIEIKAQDIDEKVIKGFTFVEPTKEYPAQDIPLDPYFLGIWLGDGKSKQASVCSIDNEIIDFIKNYAVSLGHDVVNTEKRHGKAGTYKIISSGNNTVMDALKRCNLINNKHIPDIYMHNTTDIRMQVLAGIIDTDGTLGDNVHDVTLKSERLSNDVMKLARSLGIYTSMITRQSRATNSSMEYATYFRVQMYNTRHTPSVPIKLPRKIWKWNSSNTQWGFSVPISLEQNQESFRHEWTDELRELLKTCVPKYTSQFGVIEWKKIQENEDVFKDFSPGGMRATYARIKSEQTQAVPTPTVADNIKEVVLDTVGEYYDKGDRVMWKQLMESRDIFKTTTVQAIRTIMSNMSVEERQTIENTRKMFDNAVFAKAVEHLPQFKHDRGVTFSGLLEADPLLQRYGLARLKHMFQQRKEELETVGGEAQAKRAAIYTRLSEMVQDPQYKLRNGQIKWKLISQSDPIFEGVHTDVLRNMYKSM